MNRIAFHLMNKSKYGFEAQDVFTKIRPDTKKNKKHKRERIKHSVIKNESSFNEDLTDFKLETVSADQNTLPI